MYDVVVIGAGPAGLSAALAAKELGLSCIVFEKSSVAATVRDYPLGKAIFSDACDVELLPNTFSPVAKPTREEVLHYYQDFAERMLPQLVRTETVVSAIDKRDGVFLVRTERGAAEARFVVVAVGGMGTTNTVGVPGEATAGLAYHYQEIRLHKNERVLVIGAGNSAAEAVCDLQQEGARVTWVVRRPSLDLTIGSRATPIHPSVRKPVESLLTRGLITTLFDAQIEGFDGRRAIVRAAGARHVVDYDSAFALLGRRPDHQLVRDAGAAFDADGLPRYDPYTGETSVAGLYVVGHCTREINLKNAVTRPRTTIDAIIERLAGATNVAPTERARDGDAAARPVAVDAIPDAVAQPLAQVSSEEVTAVTPPAVAFVEDPLAWVLSDPGALAIGVADYGSGALLGYSSYDNTTDYRPLIIMNAAVIRAKLAVMEALQLGDAIEDIVITNDRQLHVLRLIQARGGHYLVMVLDRGHANLALARHRLNEVERRLAM